MLTATVVNATVEGFPTPSLPNHAGKSDCASILEIHQILMANLASIKCNLGGGQNGYLSSFLPPRQYYCVSSTDFVLPPVLGRILQVPIWTHPTEEKRTLHAHAEHR